MKLTFPQALILVLAISASIGLFFVPLETIAGRFGEDKIYLGMYLIALVGSLSTFTGIPYPLFAVSFVASGFDPLFIGLAAAAGAITSDTVTFVLVRKGRRLFGENIIASADRMAKRVEQHPRLVVPGLFLYGTLAPLSNDFATIPFALMKYRALTVLLPLAAGNMLYNVTIAHAGGSLYEWLF